MRKLTDHITNPANDRITITVMDEPGPGGANHHYEVRIDDNDVIDITFQLGPIAEAGVNGLTHEVLLAILIDRLRSFQAGPFACKENENALHHACYALDWLKERTLLRMDRGVEGTHTV